MLTRFGMVSAILLLAVLGFGSPAQADGSGVTLPGVEVGCGKGGCDVEVGTPGSNDPDGGSDDDSSGGSGGGPVCTHEQVELSPEVIARVGGQPAGEGAWYVKLCVFTTADGLPRSTTDLVWLPEAPPAVTPEQLAQIARARLQLPSVGTHLNPATNSMVNVPVWLALSAGWDTRSATASVPGLSVTATATPSKVRWDMGNGSSRACSGPGSVFRTGVDDPYAASPTCGFTYSDPVGEGRTYTVRATVTYTITWSGGGQSGTLADLTATGATTLTVGESQAVVTR
jgi:hypothetical protein